TLLLLPTVPSSFFSYFFCNDPASSQFSTLSLHDALPILVHVVVQRGLQLVQLLAVGLHDRTDRLVQVCGTAQHAAGVADALPQRGDGLALLGLGTHLDRGEPLAAAAHHLTERLDLLATGDDRRRVALDVLDDVAAG